MIFHDKGSINFLNYEVSIIKIHQIPNEFKAYFNKFRDLFSLKQFYYFQIYIYSLIILTSHQKNVTQISRAWVEPICRSSLERFLSEYKWEFQKVIRRSRRQIIRVLSQRKKRAGRKVQLVIDDTTLSKFGKQIFGAAWYKKHKNDPLYFGIQVAVLGVLDGNWLIPIDFHIYVREKECEYIRLKFETKLQQAVKMLNSMNLPREYNVEVMFDSWYLNDQVTGVIEKRGWTWISRCASNRSVLWEGETKRQNFQAYVPTIEWKHLKYTTNRKSPAVVGHQRIGHLKKIGRIKAVFSSLAEDGSKRRAAFCTNHIRLPMVTVISHFEKRWKIEVFFKEARKNFALERWQYRDTVSVVNHLCLTLVAAMTCAYMRIKELDEGKGNPNESWGEFVRKLQKKNQRLVLRYFLENFEKNNDSDFNKLCDEMGL